MLSRLRLCLRPCLRLGPHLTGCLRLLPLAAALGPAAPAGAADTVAGRPAALVMCYEDVVQRPWSSPGATGLNFELLRRVERQLGERFVYAAKPWRRCIEELRLGSVDAVIATADSKARRSFAAYPLLPDGSADPARALFTDSVNVFLRAGGQGSWDGHTLVAPNQEVAVQSGYLVGAVLRERGYRPRELVKSADDGLRLLLTGMFDVAILQGIEASSLARSDPRSRPRGAGHTAVLGAVLPPGFQPRRLPAQPAPRGRHLERHRRGARFGRIPPAGRRGRGHGALSGLAGPAGLLFLQLAPCSWIQCKSMTTPTPRP